MAGALLLALSAFSFSFLPVAKSTLAGTFTVGIVASLTGDFAEWSEAVTGYKLWEQAVAAAGGFPLRDINGTTYRYGVQLVVLDDKSSALAHATAVSSLLNSANAHFILGASPVFAEAESIQVQSAGLLNFHCCAGSASIYARDQKNVFGMSVDNYLYTQELFTEFRSNNIYKLAVAYRADVLELQTACQGVVSQAKSQLMTITLELKYYNSSTATLANLVAQLNSSTAEALIMCGLSAESSTMAVMIDKARKPLKAIVYSGGAYKRAWNDQLGNLSKGIVSFAHWSPDISRKDAFWGDSSTYSGKFKSAYQDDATYIAAAASATGYVLQSVLGDSFRKCTLSAAALANTTDLLFTQDAITCTDNNNRGHDRLIDAMAIVNMNTFYGAVAFDRFRQNQGYDPVILQTYETSENLKRSYKPSLVLPLVSATRPLLMPQPNLYAPTCLPGTYRGPDDFLPCIACDVGEFQEFAGRTSCELCPKDFYANVTSMPYCVACPKNTLTVQRGSTNLTDCICKPGYFDRDGLAGHECEACPKNAVCEGGTAKPYPVMGFYAEEDAPFTMYRCNPASVCTGNFTCSSGYRGRMCFYCAKGYFRFLGNCVSCPSSNLSVLGYLIVLAMLWITINIWFARTVENLMVVINFCQLLSIVVGFSLNWPSKLYQAMSLSSIFSFEMDSLEPTCLVPSWGFSHNLVIQLLLPMMMGLLVGVWILITYVTYKVKQMRMTRSVKAAASMRLAHTAPWKQVLWDLLEVPADKRELNSMILERCAIPLNFLNIGYLVLLKYNLSAFKCTQINSEWYMSASPNDRCYTPKHWNLMILGTTGLIVYNFGFVFLYGHVMRQLRKYRALGDKTPLLLYGWMYERYEAQYCWYETIIILQRTGFVLVALFVNDPALQAVLCMVISIAVLLLDIDTSAYMDKSIHMLQAVADGVLGALLVAGLLFYNPLIETSVVKAVEYLLLAAVISALVSAAVSVFYGIFIRLLIMWLMSKHRPIAYKMGQRVKGYRHVYTVFGPIFLFQWLRRCTADEWNDWHHLCMVLIDYVHPTSEVSYLSLKKAGRFWRYLLSNFPETIDYLVSVNEENREHFNSFIEALYDNFFDTKDEHQYQVYYFINDKFKAAFAQWLSSCDDDDRTFCQQVMKTAIGKAKGAQAANELSAAMSRSSKLSSTLTVLSAVDKFKKQVHKHPPPRPSISTLKSSGGGASVRFRAVDAAGEPSMGSAFERAAKKGDGKDSSGPPSQSGAGSETDLFDPSVAGGKAFMGQTAAANTLMQRRTTTPPSLGSPPGGNQLEPQTPQGLTAALAAANVTSVAGLSSRSPVRAAAVAERAGAAVTSGTESPKAVDFRRPSSGTSFAEVETLRMDATVADTVVRQSSGLTSAGHVSSSPAIASSGSPRRFVSAKFLQPDGLPSGDVVYRIGNPDVEEVALGELTSAPRDGGAGDGLHRARPLVVRGDSADSFRELDRHDSLGHHGSLASPMIMPVARTVASPAGGSSSPGGATPTGSRPSLFGSAPYEPARSRMEGTSRGAPNAQQPPSRDGEVRPFTQSGETSDDNNTRIGK